MAAHADGRDPSPSLEERVESDLAHLFQETPASQHSPSAAARPAHGPRDATQEIERYRARLLDLRNGNRLLHFEHTERSRAHVRAIDAAPDALYAQLNEGHQLLFVSLPEPEGERAEADGDEFLMALEEARANDPDYVRLLAELDEADADSLNLQAAEGALRERVREQLGLPHSMLSGALPLAEHARKHGIDPSLELPRPSAPGKTKPAGSIQTLLRADDMDRKLTGLHDRARTSLQEKGVNTLYAVFGFLEWYESPAAATPFHAPLLLVPVEIKRKVFKSRYRYAIRATGEEPQINLTLAARIAADFGIELPEFGEEDGPETYFEKVTQALSAKHRWRVRRWVTIGHFAFARLVMYRDLDPRNWHGASALERHPVLSAMFGGARGASEGGYAEEHDADHPDVAKKVPLLITDADSSQFSALVDALDGESLALQGPPGTGKSQTITNLIAAALAANKTVLFVAEKLAALEVVKNRLAAAGLGEFVLELHSTRAGKKEVMGSIAERLKIQGRVRPPANLERDLEQLAAARSALASHAALLNGAAGKLGLTLHQCLWAELRLRQQHALPAAVAEVRVRDALAVTPEQAEHVSAHLAFVEQANAAIRARHGRVQDHPWFGLERGGLAGADEAALLQALQGWSHALDGVRARVAAFERTSGTRAPAEPSELAALAVTLTRLPGGGEVDARWFAALSDRTTRSELKAYRESVAAFREARDQLARCGDPVSLWENPARILELARKARELKLADRSVAELGALLAGYKSDYAAWAGVVDTARQLLKLYGIEGPVGSRTVMAAMEGARIVASTPPEALVLRERALMDPVNGGALEDAARRQLDVQAELRQLGPDFSLPLDDPEAPARLRRHAAALNGAGFLRSFSSRVRAAREAWSELRRRPGQADDAEKSAQLYAIAAAVEAAQEFTGDERLLELCTTHFRGHETDFHRLLAVNRFAREVRERLGTDSVLRSVRTVLLEGNLDTLNDIVAFASPEVAQGLQWALSKSGPDSTHWEAFAIEVGEWARSIATLLEAAAELGLAGEVSFSELEALAAVAERAARCRSAMESAVAARILGPTFAPTLAGAAETDAPALDGAVDVVVGLVSLGLSEELLAFLLCEDFVERRAEVVEHGNALAAALAQAEEHGAAALAAGAIDESAFLGRPAAELPFETVRARLARALESAAELGSWSAYSLALQVVEDAGLTPLLAAYEDRPYEHLAAAFRQALLRSIVRAASEQDPALAEVSGEGRDAARAQFQELEREVARQQCKELRSELCRRRLDPGEKSGSKSSWTGLALLQNEVKKRARHFPIRDLVRRAGRALQQAKPCFMMSPPSVAQYLAQGSVSFDLVVIDEASQMRPEDAIGALARGRQAIVVGDPMQLPPTGFFDRERPPTDEELAAEERVNDESILEAALAAFRPARKLRWHYRSRHPALIAFSNAHFYQGDLVVFPAPSTSDPALGVHCVPVENGLYRGSMNRPEAERVAGEALRFMQDNHGRSLGIVAMNQPQRDLIMHEVERIVARDARAQRYSEHWESERGGLEAFFVKSLETVQGDERDVIFVSATYGPDASGRVHQRFGPINGPHGHRRLNVLFTRAKERVVLFTSMRPDQVEVDEHASLGRRALRSYLEYALHGSPEASEGAASTLESELEAFVLDVLRTRGYEAELRVGASGPWIDLAVRHPQSRGAFVLGLEGDGPSYLGVRSTRDRDRLRPQVLAALGWQLHRIWSLAWYADPEKESARLLAAVEQAARRHDRAAKKAG
jgi:DNA polymerase III delta prime subunit